MIKGTIHSKETKKKMSKSRLGKKHSKETKIKIGLANKGSIHTEETKRKISKTKKGIKLTKEHRRKIGLGGIGKIHSAETKKKMSLAHLGVIFSKKHRRKIGLANKGKKPFLGKKHSEITKRKLSIIHKEKKHSKKSLQIMRESQIKYMKEVKNINVPSIGRNEKQILDNIEKENNIKLLRQYSVIGYFLDGYDEKNNVVYEINEIHHFDFNKTYTNRHIERKNNIIKHLKCIWIDIKDAVEVSK